MREQVSKVERLDIAAKAIIARNVLHHEQVFMLFMAAMCTLLGFLSTASQIEILAIRALAGTCIVLLVLFLLEWRYSFHAFLLASVGAAIAGYWVHLQLYPHSSWIGSALVACFFLSIGAKARPWAVPFATAHQKGWEEDHQIAKRLFARLMDMPGPEEKIRISAGNFWVGYFTYHIVLIENCWAIGKFKRGNDDRMLEFRVLDKDSVRVTEPAGTAMELYIAGRKIRNPQLEPESYQRLMRLAMHSSPT